MIVDPVTKITYEFGMWPSIQTRQLLQMLKDRYEMNILGYYVAEAISPKKIHIICSENGIKFDANNQLSDLQRHARQHGFIELTGGGRDSLLIIKSASMKVDDVELNVNKTASTTSISKKFTKTLNSNRANKVLLNKFINYILIPCVEWRH